MSSLPFQETKNEQQEETAPAHQWHTLSVLRSDNEQGVVSTISDMGSSSDSEVEGWHQEDRLLHALQQPQGRDDTRAMGRLHEIASAMVAMDQGNHPGTSHQKSGNYSNH